MKTGAITRRTVLGALVVLLASVGASVPAVASDHRPPRTALVVGEREQRGRLGTYCWTASSPPGFVRSCADAIYSFPRPIRARRGSSASIVLEKAQPPSDISLVSWRRLNRHGYPRGPARRIEVILLPTIRESGIAWEARFDLPDRLGHLYLSLFATWTDEEGTFLRDDASWTYHARLRAPPSP